MNKKLLIGGLLFGLAISSLPLEAAPRLRLDPGEAQVVYSFDSYNTFASAEGIAVDARGNIIVTHRIFNGVQWIQNQILEISPDGQVTEIADLGPAMLGYNGLVGVVTDHYGTAYVAFYNGDQTNGVWKVYRNGYTEHMPGSEQINVPNALTVDQHGNLYVSDYMPYTDEAPGLVWRCENGGEFEIWATSHLLAPDPYFDPIPFPLGGANGIVYGPPNNIYVANSEKSLIVHIPVLSDGSPGEISVVSGAYPPIGPPGWLMTPDGLAMDAKGMLYTVVPSAGISGMLASPVVRIDPTTGEAEPVVEPYVAISPLFDFPTSLAFGRGKLDKKSLYVTSMGSMFFGLPPGVGAGSQVTQVGVGTPGQAGH